MPAPTILEYLSTKRTLLDSGNFAIPHGLGTGWNRLRIGFRYQFNGGAALASTPRFAVGLCSGGTNIFQDATTTNFVGGVSNGANWSRNAGSFTYYIITNGLYAATRIGSTLTIGTSLSGSNMIHPADPSQEFHRMLLVDILKGSPNWSVRAFFNTGTTAADTTEAQLLAQLPLLTPALTGYSLGSDIAIAFDEIPGVVDHVNIAWDRSDATLQIEDLAVALLA